MKYAIVAVGGRQYKIAEGQNILVDKLDSETGSTIGLDSVLLLVDGDKKHIGNPTVKEAKIKAKIVEQVQGQKIRVATYKAKARYRKVKGHRAQLTKLLIEQISI